MAEIQLSRFWKAEERSADHVFLSKLQLWGNLCTRRNFFEIFLNQPEIRLYLPFSDWFGSKWTSVWIQINQKMVNTFWFRVDLIRFWKYFSVCILETYRNVTALWCLVLYHVVSWNIPADRNIPPRKYLASLIITTVSLRIANNIHAKQVNQLGAQLGCTTPINEQHSRNFIFLVFLHMK